MKIDFSKNDDGLVPAIIQDAQTDRVLMLGFMNEEALKVTRKSGRVTFFSRSRQTLWTKGETSGNFLVVDEILIDCDADTILIKANPTGPTCHSGSDTCFSEINEHRNFLATLEKIIADRRDRPSEHSYTSQLFAAGLNRIAQKVGEEAVELVIAAKDDDRQAFVDEAADLLFHLLVLIAAKDTGLTEISETLRRRHKPAAK